MTTNTIPSSEIDPLLLSLGQLIGIIKVSDGSVELQSDWFSDPFTVSQQTIKNNPEAFVSTITQLLGEVGGNALGIPFTDPALLGTWYPLNFGSTNSGLYLVSYPSPDNDEILVIGFGTLVQWHHPDKKESDNNLSPPLENVSGDTSQIGPDSVKILAWGLMPLVELGAGEFKLALGQSGRPFSIGASIEGGDSQRLFDGVDISLQGIKTSASIDLGSANPIDLSLVFMELKLPNVLEARDISLVELAALSDQEILSTVASIALSALAQTGIEKDKLSYVLPVFGLAKNVPDVDGEVPLLDWVSMAKAALNNGNPVSPILAWFAYLVDDTEAGKAWLTALGQLIGSVAPSITGTGTRNDPLALTLASVDKVGSFQFTLGYQTNAQGTRQFYPGVVFTAQPQGMGGSEDYVLLMNAALELGQMNLELNGSLSSQPDSLQGEAGFLFQRGKPDELLVDIASPKLSVGSVRAGIALANGMQLQPDFELTNVTTENGHYASLSLLNLEQIAEVGVDSLIAEIVNKLEELLGIQGEGNVAFGTSVGTIIGLIPPALPDGTSWPATPPLSKDGLLKSLANPIEAMTGYYTSLLSENAGDKLAFTYMVEAFGSLLAEAGGPSINVSGSGTELSPWRVSLASGPVSLLIFQQDGPTGTKNKLLTLGFELNPLLAFAGLPTLDLDITVHAVGLGIGNEVDAKWLPKVSATLAINQTLESPTIAGAKITAESISMGVGWGNESDWAWNMKVEKPSIVIGQDCLSLNENLAFSDTEQLNRLMTQSNFATLLVRVMGLFIARTSQPSALAIDGILGLLPDLSAHLPSEINWPDDMPVLAPSDFNDPIGVLQAQLQAITAEPANLKAATTLAAWAITNGQSVPEIRGNGDLPRPFQMPLGFASGFNLLIFSGRSNSLGLGLGRPFTAEPVSGVQVDTDIQLLAGEVPLGDSSVSNKDTPCLQMSVTFTSTNGKVTSFDSKDIDGLVFKVVLSLDNGLVVTPETFLLSGSDLLSMGSNAQAYFGALNDAFTHVIKNLKGNETFENSYTLFADLGLVLKDKSGISTEGWNALFANPLNWFTNGLVEVLSNKDSRANLFTLIQQMLGIKVPSIPDQVLEILSAMGLLTTRSLGYAPVPEAIIQLANSPVSTLTNAFEELMNDSEKLLVLTSAIAGSDEGEFGPFKWQIANGNQIQITTAESIAVGSLVELSGVVSLNLSNGIISAGANVYVPQVRMAFVPEINWRVGQSPQTLPLEVNILWGDGKEPSAPELTLYPFEQQKFIQQFTALGPYQTVSSFVTMLLDQHVIKPYPLAAVLMEGLGLLVKQGDQLTFKSLLGLFDNPVDWLLSGSVFGSDGTLDIRRLANLLKDIPNVSGNGITVSQLPAGQTGVSVTGLPYGVQLHFAVDELESDNLNFVTSVAATTSISQGVADVTLHSAIRLNRTFQPGITGNVKLLQNTTQTYAQTGFDKGFNLSLGQTDGAILQLVPFAGWQALIEAATAIAIQALIQKITSQILTELENSSASDFVKRLRVAGGTNQLDVKALVDELSQAQSTEDILEKALSWLNVRLSDAGAGGTAQAIATLLDGLIPGTIAPESGLVSWAPSNKIPITLLSGRDDKGLLGFWAEVDFPDTGLLNVTLSRSGVGVDPANNFDVNFSFGLDLQVPVVLQNNGPVIQMAFDASNNRFNMLFDPQQDNGNASQLKVELLPEFFKETTLSEWLVSVLKWVVPRYGSIVLLDITQVKNWLDSPVVDQDKAPTPADLLVGSGLIDKVQSNYVLTRIDDLLKLTPQRFIGGFLSTLLENPIKVLTIGKDGGVWLDKNSELGYGVRLKASDITVDALPNVTFQLGAEENRWIEKSGESGAENLQPGLAAYLPISDAPDFTPDFAGMSLVMSNVGLDIHGKNQSPLVSISRFSMERISPRTLLQVTFDDTSKTVIGGSLEFQNLGWALSPNSLPQTSKVNPVAANLLGSGSSPDSENPPTDPTFSAIAAYTHPGQFWAGLQNASGDVVDQVIIPIQQSFGPLNVQQISVMWKNADTKLGVGFTGGLDISALSMTVFDLSVGVDVSNPLSLDSYDLDLRGLAVAFNAGSVDIAGGLVKVGTGQDVLYNGAINVNVGRFGISAVGSYGLMTDTVTNKKHPSFFVFAASGFPIGGPPAFFIKGFSGGFAYNRSLKLPQPDAVQNFILVEAASDPEAIFGVDPTPSQALSKMSEVISPEVGSYWMAAGLHFTSYSLIDTTALAVVEFGNNLSVSLLGVSTISQPPLVKDPGKALMFAQLGIVITVDITKGSLIAQAQLTPASFVLDKNCKISGGFVLAIWWSPNKHSGDFCLSLGGYNANYTPPDYYPVVPRLRLRWPIAGASILGEAYFALTPNAVMAGGRLELEFKEGPLRAWFKSNADFIIAWKPFYYDVDISISIGAALTTKLLGTTITLKAELGAALHLWGPPTAGKVTVNWYVISFSIPIGDQNPNLDNKPLGSWNEFAKNFLPPPTKPDTKKLVNASTEKQEVLRLQISKGLIEGEANTDVWTMQRIGFELRADSAVPGTKAIAGNLSPLNCDAKLGVRPMDVSTLTSEFTFILTSQGKNVTIDSSTFDINAYNANSPMGLWATTQLKTKTAPATNTVIPDTMTSVAISGQRYKYCGGLGPANLSVFNTEKLCDMNFPLSLNAPFVPDEPLPQTNPIHTVMTTVMEKGVVQLRNDILAALQQRKLHAPLNPDLYVMSSQGNNIFQAPPVLAKLGQTLAQSPTSVLTRSLRSTADVVAPQSLSAPVCLGGARRYAGKLRVDGNGRIARRPTTANWINAQSMGDNPSLRRGSVALYSIDVNAPHTVDVSGELGVRVIGFDERQEPACIIQHSTDDQMKIELPDGLEHAAVCGADNYSGIAGWQIGSKLVRVNPRYLLGDDCLVKPQAIIRSSRVNENDICSAEHMLSENQLEYAEGRKQGWVTTWLPEHHDRACVLLGCDADGVEYAVVEKNENGKLRRRQLNPLLSHDSSLACQTANFDISGLALDGWVRLMVRATKENQLNGVISYSGNIGKDAEGTSKDGVRCLGQDAHCLKRPVNVNVRLVQQGG